MVNFKNIFIIFILLNSGCSYKSAHDKPITLPVNNYNANLRLLRNNPPEIASIQRHLKVIRIRDQKFRLLYDSLLRNYNIVDNSICDSMIFGDSVDLKYILNLLNTYGWIPNIIIGDDAQTTFFLVIQHADLNTQLHALPLLTTAVLNHDAPKKNYAFLIDRILIQYISRQIYGTQIYYNFTTRKYLLLPLLYPNILNQLRQSVDLCPIDEYLNLLNS